MKITVAIPNYKNKESLVSLIDQLSKEAFDKVYVLDDCSPNLTEITTALAKYKNVEVVPSNARLLPTKNRNRVLEVDTGEVILFLDSDLVKISKDVSKELNHMFQDKKLGILGGQIIEKDKPMIFNYGTGPFWPIDRSWLFAWLRPLSKIFFAANRSKTITEPLEATWLAEGVMAVRATTFRELNGFDANFELFHEGPDLCHRAIKNDYRVVFDPRIKFEHLHLEHVEKKNNINRSTAYWFYKHYRWPKWLANFLFRYKGQDIVA